MKRLFINIGKLIQVEQGDLVQRRCGKEMSSLGIIENGYLLTDDDLISDFGMMSQLTDERLKCMMPDESVDVCGRMVLPTFCDSHTHLVYAGSREIEFFDKLKGLSYSEIAARGGGILNSAKLLHEAAEDDLLKQALLRAREIVSFGTGAVEIKSGYGLSLEDELKMLRVARRIGEFTPLTVKTTFLGAHAVPARYTGRREEYVDEIISEMIPVIATEELADYIDVFTEEGFFSVEDTDRILNAGMKYGLRPKVHANQMSFSGGVQVGVKYNAISVDHLEYTGEEEFRVLKESETMATLLPGATQFLEMDYAPAREMIDYGLPVAIATNYNPGSCPSGDMRYMMFLGALKMKMTPNELINATTINGAYAMGLEETHGTIAVGKKANFLITAPIPSIEFIPYAYTSSWIDKIYLNGRLWQNL
ncbi:Imidazolonepropionase [Bacteroidales bacterium CF]|nr:Imidazolonepropionase [Bacteroidales bacterium CF]